MKMFRVFFLSLLIMLGFYNLARADFIEGLEDIPLMSKLKQVKSDTVSFGNEESRLVETYLSGNDISFSEVEAFYINTLPQLGWSFEGKKGNTLSFYRDSESIEIVKEKSSPILIRITLKSRG